MKLIVQGIKAVYLVLNFCFFESVPPYGPRKVQMGILSPFPSYLTLMRGPTGARNLMDGSQYFVESVTLLVVPSKTVVFVHC